MRIVIDLQGAQSESRYRGIGRYSLALALGMARNAGQHELWLVLNGALGDSIADLRDAFDGLIPQERIRVFDIAGPVAAHDHRNDGRARAAELLREAFIDALKPDAVLITSLFEGYVDDSVISIGSYTGAAYTAVILYDLIPYLNPERYLGTPAQRDYYGRKITSLRNAGLVLSISDYSRQEGLDALGFAPERVVSISTAVDECFAPAPADPQALAALQARLGISRDVVMYAPGGFDSRKNIAGLIEAYGLLPPALRQRHQLLIASKISEHDRADMQACAHRAGLAEDELILTGYVDDATLIALYRAATLFVFPSLHEGFGLPALEAMACGAPVIGANNTSIPEVIGSDAALFDAGSPRAIADKIIEVLGDPLQLQNLREHGARQAARFSWDVSAQRALRALESQLPKPAPAPRTRRRLAFVSPLPPERTGIADYALEILPALTEHFEIELILQQDRCTLPRSLSKLPQRTVAWFRQNAERYDQVMYQFGNSPFHSHMVPLLADYPGVVVLHDFFLSGMVAYDQLSGNVPGAWSRALFNDHGYAAMRAGQQVDGIDLAKDSYPCNLAVLENATRVIVHSEYARTLARQWYHPQAGHDWSVVPHARALAGNVNRERTRRALGIHNDTFLVCSFGFIAPTKLTQELVQAWMASALQDNQQCVLALVGANHGGDYGAELSKLVEAAGARVRITGWADDPLYHQYLQAADAAVQLRSTSRGETSGAVLYCMSYGVPTIINANGSLGELPADAVWMLDDRFAQSDLVEALETLQREPVRRNALAEAGRALLAREYSPEHCARLYAEAADLAWAAQGHDRHGLAPALAALPELPRDNAYLQQLSACLARLPDHLTPRQLLVDVTAIARHDLKTGIERVVRTQLLELLRHGRPGWRVEPVYLVEIDGHWHYRYARRYAFSLLGMLTDGVEDPLADVNVGDIYYSGDSSPGEMMAAARQGLYAHWRARGVSVNFVVYDLLPVLAPQFFPVGADSGHAAWLAVASANADRLISISAAVRDDLRIWLAQHGAARKRPPQLEVLHLGADIDAQACPAVPGNAAHYPLLAQFQARPTILMVGTIEPRKGHLQALDAFEQLWAEGLDINLVIVGHEGWTPLADHERRTIPTIVRRLNEHPQREQRLFWLKGIDDAYLLQVYQASDCLLFASEGEGYGLPLIEAARYGLPVLARDLPVFREVAEQHAHYFSGMAGADLALAIREWLALDAAGTAPASSAMRSMSWKENADSLLQLLSASAEAKAAGPV